MFYFLFIAFLISNQAQGRTKRVKLQKVFSSLSVNPGIIRHKRDLQESDLMNSVVMPI